MKRIVSVAVLLALTGVLPARAAGGNSCQVVATGYPGTNGDCRYTATSTTGTYAVVTITGFVLSASSDGGAHYRTLVDHIAPPGMPAEGVTTSAGQFTVKVGDIVVAAIAIVRLPSATIQDGFITAADS